MKNFHLFAKLCKITPNFYLILCNEVTVGENRKFLTLTKWFESNCTVQEYGSMPIFEVIIQSLIHT